VYKKTYLCYDVFCILKSLHSHTHNVIILILPTGQVVVVVVVQKNTLYRLINVYINNEYNAMQYKL